MPSDMLEVTNKFSILAFQLSMRFRKLTINVSNMLIAVETYRNFGDLSGI